MDFCLREVKLPPATQRLDTERNKKCGQHAHTPLCFNIHHRDDDDTSVDRATTQRHAPHCYLHHSCELGYVNNIRSTGSR